MKRWLSILLCLMLLIPACALGSGSPITWRYTFSAGDALSGEAMEGVRNLLEGIGIELTRQQTESQSLGRIRLIGERDKEAFSLRAAADSDGGSFGLFCSLTGNCTLVCRQEQLDDFLLTLVKMLSDLSLLKNESLAQANHLAVRASEVILKITDVLDQDDPEIGLAIAPYLDQLGGLTTASSQTELDGTDPVCPGAVLRRSWQLSEEDLNRLIDTGLTRLAGIPILGDALAEGRLRIGSQQISNDFIRTLFASMHGETSVELYEDAKGRLMRMSLLTPDASELLTDPVFAQARGLEINVQRTEEPDGSAKSETSLRMIGPKQDALLTIRMEKGPGTEIEPLPDRKVYQVGELDSSSLWQLIRELGLTITKNAVNMILVLPRIIFDTLVDKLF